MNIHQIYVERVDSTNSYLRRQIESGFKSDGMVVVYTDDQYAGRGQKGNSWESEPYQNLSFSILIHPTFIVASRQFILSEAMALSIVRVLNRLCVSSQEQFTVKWPNDIYFNDQKVCGTLIECNLQGKLISDCIIGTGLNVNQQVFVSDAPNPVSLYQIFGREFDRMELLDSILKEFEKIYLQLASGDSSFIRKEYASNLYRKEGYHAYRDVSGAFVARIAQIEESGHLILEDQNGRHRRYAFKEVQFV